MMEGGESSNDIHPDDSSATKKKKKSKKSKKDKQVEAEPTSVEVEAPVADIETAPAQPVAVPANKASQISTSGIILALALGVHSLFEGVAFGLMPTVE